MLRQELLGCVVSEQGEAAPRGRGRGQGQPGKAVWEGWLGVARYLGRWTLVATDRVWQ